MHRYLSVALLVAGCTGTQVTSAPPRTSPPAVRTPELVSKIPSQSTAKPERRVLAAVPPAPSECNDFRAHALGATFDCSDRKHALTALDRALQEANAMARDAALAVLGSCSGLEPGVVLALRAEYAPAACGDVIVGDFVELNKPKLTSGIADALSGLKLAAQLTRLVRSAPQIAQPYTKERIDAFVRGVMATWATEQANAIGELSIKGARLTGYGKGLVAIDAGLADMRFVEIFRQVPLPEEFANDPELAEAYYSALDQGLEPRKARGRDAALVGLRLFSEVGALHDSRVGEARRQLSRLYNGRRIDALDSLLLPPLEAPTLADEEHRLAVKLPTFYVAFVLGATDPAQVDMLRALFEQGLPAAVHMRLERAVLSPVMQQLYARSLFELGRTYWRAADFAAAAKIGTNHSTVSEVNTLISALSHALENGPRDAAAMMLGGTQLGALGSLSELDSLAKGKGLNAALAAYDAALVRELGPAGTADVEFYKDLASRYERAAALLKDPALKKVARERAAAAAETAKKLH